jgi:hypothetical protein
VPNTITITRNKVRGSFFGDVVSGDDTIAVSAGDNILIEQNWFTENYNIEQVIDIKSRNSTTPIIIRKNLFTKNFLGTKGGQDAGPGSGGPCLTIGDHDAPSNLLQHIVEENWFENCAAANNPSAHFFINVGSSSRPGSALIRNNVFVGERITAPTAIFNQAYNTLVINNTIYRGGFKIGRSGGCIPANHLTFKNNIFYETNISDQTDSCSGNKYALLYNDLYDLPQGFERGNQSNNITANPQFVDPANDKFALKSTSPAIGAGADGVDMGAKLSDEKKPLPPSNLRVSFSP